MAAAGSDEDFDDWLCNKLKALNTDPDIFASYIRGILDSDDTTEEKLDALQGILVEIPAKEIPQVSKEIVDKWNSASAAVQSDDPHKYDVGAQLASIMEKQTLTVVNERKLSEEERKYREAILAQYSQVSDDEGEDQVGDYKATAGAATSTATSSIAAKNTNAEDVMKAEKEKRDKAKAECEKKKATDKANKEKQKQQQQERKDKEKKRTQKGERKR